MSELSFYSMTEDEFNDIAEAIQYKTGSSESIKGSEFAEKIMEISTDDTFNAIFGNGTDVVIYGPNVTTLPTFTNNTRIKEVHFPNVTTIPNNCFKGCTNLEVAEFGSCTSVGDNAFTNCTKLTTVSGLENVTGISYYAFDGCTHLTSVGTLSKVTNIYYYAFRNCYALTSIDAPLCTTLNGYSSNGSSYGNHFQNCSSLVNVNLPRLSSLVESAFWGCSSLVEINLPYVTNLGAGSVFYGCTKLETVRFSNNFNGSSIGRSGYNSPFENCSSLTDETMDYLMNLPTVTNIYGGFPGCSSVTSVTIPSRISNFPAQAFFKNCSSLTSVTIEKAITSIPSNFFEGCSSLKTFTIPSTVTSIGSYAFRGCTSLEEVDFSNNNLITIIPSYCFDGCSSLTSFEFTPKITTIQERAFQNCGLISINIPSTVTSKGNNYIFTNCTSLKKVVYNTTSQMPYSEYQGCTALEEVIITPNVVVTVTNGNSMSFLNTNSTWILYVDPSKVNDYKNNSYWQANISVDRNNRILPYNINLTIDDDDYGYTGGAWNKWLQNSTLNPDGFKAIGNNVMNSERTHYVYDTTKGKAVNPTDYIASGDTFITLELSAFESWDEFQEVEYIESTGTQKIVTDYYMTPLTKVIIDQQFTAVETQARFLRASSNSGSYEVYINGSSKWAYSHNNGGGDWLTTNVSADTQRHTVTYDGVLNKLTISETSVDLIMSGTPTQNSSIPIEFLARTEPVNTTAKAKLYSAQVYENSVIACNFKPCYHIETGIIGMFDIINNKFYTNAGTGTFNKGADVQSD